MTDPAMPDARGRIALLAGTFAAVLVLAGPPRTVRAQATSPGAEIFAQKLVTKMQARHPEADEIGLMTMTRHGCRTIASTDRSDRGEKCEEEDSQPMRTGKPHVGKEEGGYAVSLPLHDSAGKAIGAVAIEFKAAKGQTEASATEAARKIEREMAAKLPSKAKLFQRSQ